VAFDPDDPISWAMVEGGTKVGGGKVKERLSEVGHGQVLPDSSPAAVSFARIEQQSTVSFAALRRVRAHSDDAGAAARALVASIGIAGHVTAFGRAFSLRSGCELRPRIATWTWLGAADEELSAPSIEEAVQLVRDCAALAEAAGLPVGSRWPTESLRLEPAPNLANAIRRTWPEAE
jgi:CRISPR-associated protein Csb1